MAPLEPGTAVAGYRIVRLLRAGPGAGAVYEATGGGLDRAVALKVFSERLSGSSAFRERFRHEAPRIAAVEHPGIARTYEAGSSRDGLYLAMRLVPGRTLAELLASGPLEADAALELLGPVAEALDVAHDSGVLHGDLKPEKILVGDVGRAFLTGFSIVPPQARGPSSRARSAALYLAPERARGDPARRSGEIYSFGALLYEALAGAPPPRAGADGANGGLPTLLERQPELPERFDEIFAGALSSDTSRRPGNAAEMVAELRWALRAGAAARAPARPAAVLTAAEIDPDPEAIRSAPARPAAVRRARPAAELDPAAAPELDPAAAAELDPDPEVMRSAPDPAAPSTLVAAGSSQPAAPSVDERLARRRAERLATRRRRPRRAVPVIAGLAAAAAVAGWYLAGVLERPSSPPVAARVSAPPPTSDAYEAALAREIERLNERRATLEVRLARASAASGQASAADALAQAHSDAARALAGEPRTQQERRAGAAIVAALGEVATAYRAVGSRARRGDARGFRLAAAQARRADARVRRAVRGLTALGYSVE